MLVINRKPNEGIAVDGPAVVRVIHCRKSGRATLHIDAPESTRIVRLAADEGDPQLTTPAKSA